MADCNIAILLLVSHTCTERPQQIILFPVPFQANLFCPIKTTPHALNFLGEPLPPTLLSAAYALVEES